MFNHVTLTLYYYRVKRKIRAAPIRVGQARIYVTCLGADTYICVMDALSYPDEAALGRYLIDFRNVGCTLY